MRRSAQLRRLAAWRKESSERKFHFHQEYEIFFHSGCKPAGAALRR
jgi:hypothetical protein